MSTPNSFQEVIEGLLLREKQVEPVPVGMREIYRAGEAATMVYFARSGMVKLTEDHGEEGITLAVVGAGELFGEETLLGAPGYRASAARVAKGEILRVPVLVYQRLASRYPELWRALAAQMAERLRLEQQNFRRLVNASTDQRIVAMLEHLAPSCPLVAGGERSMHNVPLTQAELALMVGASRETTSSALNAMERQGSLELRRGRILIPQRVTRAASAG